MATPLVFISFALFVICLITGFLVEYVFRDFSKTSTGYLCKRSCFSQFNVCAHVCIGIVSGMLTLPCAMHGLHMKIMNNAGLHIELGTEVLFRQILGLSFFIVYTLRNLWKHTAHLKKALTRVGMKQEFSCARSSVTRQQTQIGLGLSFAGFVFEFLFPDRFAFNKYSIAYCSIAGLVVLQAIIQLVFHHDCSEEHHYRVDSFKGKIAVDDNEKRHDVGTWRKVLLKNGFTERQVADLVEQVLMEDEQNRDKGSDSESRSDEDSSDVDSRSDDEECGTTRKSPLLPPSVP